MHQRMIKDSATCPQITDFTPILFKASNCSDSILVDAIIAIELPMVSTFLFSIYCAWAHGC